MDCDLDYQLMRSRKRKKTISLHIREGGKIVVYAPYDAPKCEIEGFILEKKSWIVQKVWEKERAPKETEKTFIPGEKFLYLGEWYPLEIGDNHLRKGRLTLSFGKFILDKNHIEEAKDLFIQWYKAEAREKIAGRVHYHSQRLQLFPTGTRITSAKWRWGSCSHDNRLSFSWRIILAPLNIIDYVMIHELVHIKEKNHSQRFWNYVASILPDYKEYRLWLKKNGHALRF